MRTIRSLLLCFLACGAFGCDDELLAGWEDPSAGDASVSDSSQDGPNDAVIENTSDTVMDVEEASADAMDAEVEATGDSGPTDCEQAGGTCSNVSATSCSSGHWASPATHTCGGSVGILCCLPGPGPVPDAGEATVCEAIGGNCVSILFDTCVNAVWDQPIPFLCGTDIEQGCCFSL